MVQRALIFWFDYKIKEKFPNEDMKTDIFPKCLFFLNFSPNHRQEITKTLIYEDFIFIRIKKYILNYLLPTQKDNEREMYHFGRMNNIRTYTLGRDIKTEKIY